jgi:1-acyl-sn-glycerol-3-phosphate acyltransferase
MRAEAWGRSVAFAGLSALTSGAFVLLYPLILAPRGVVWAILSVHIRAQLFWQRWVAGVGYRIDGLEHVPDGPCILASRHESMWETILLPWVLGNPAVLLKREILAYPIAGPVARKLGYIGVDRSGDLEAAKRAFRQAQVAIESGRSVLIFPSGTREPGRRDRVQGGVAVLYRQLGVPVVPITLNSGDHWVFGSWLRWPGTIRIRVLPPIAPDLPTRDFMARLERDLTSGV